MGFNLHRMQLSLFLLTLVSQEIFSQADSRSITIGERVSLDSEVLGESRELWIATPARHAVMESVSPIADGYPVLYLLDGDSNFQHTSAVAQFLAEANRIPPMIVVGILNTDRGRDLTPRSSSLDDHANFPSHGGAARFQEFLADELFPFMRNNYETHPFRILVGHSLGGLFAIHTLTTRPELFDAYIAISPSLQWSDQGLVDQAADYFEDLVELPVDVFITHANEGGQSLAAIRRLTAILGESAPRDFRWDFRQFPEEHHGSVPLRSTYYGLEAVFEGWSFENGLEIYDIGGIDAVRRLYADGARRFGFERSLSSLLVIQMASELIQLGRLDDAAQLLTVDLGAPPPSYFLNLLADGYLELGDSPRAREMLTLSLSNNPADQASRRRLEELGIDPATVVETFSISASKLLDYVGEYALQPGFTLSIFVQNGKLYSQGTGQRASELLALSETLFSVVEGDAQLEFIGADGGPAERLVLQQFGLSMEATRLVDQ